ncbi:MAG: flagellar biosynthesis protein FlgM [Rhizobiales bacterium]|nr:flagellar biosynthesis protein FlgM [Hyphomicrobiales bacterium]
MQWRGRRQSSNIEDRRSQGGPMGASSGRGFRIPIGGGGRGSGLSFRTVIILVVLFVVLRAVGIDPLALLNGGDAGLTGQGQSTVNDTAANDEMKQFVATVLAETEDVWTKIFVADGKTYPEPTLVLFSGAVRSACGTAQSAMGPFYCPGDRKVYIDLDFYDELRRRFKAPGDFAQAYVLAHEVGHHVQNLIGVLPRFNKARQSMSQTEANRMSVRVELQADCFAGVWAYHTQQKGLLEAGDIEEALNAATQIGDDAIQQSTQGYVVPDSFNHGSSAQRQRWFSKGLQSGEMAACDTFNAASL